MDLKTTLDIIGSIVTILGLPVLIWSIFLLGRQLRLQVYQTVNETILEIDEFFTENYDLLPFVLENVPIPEDDPKLRLKVLNAAALLMDYFVHLHTLRGLQSKEIWAGWQNYMRDVYKTSPALRYYIETNRSWYTYDLIHILQGDQKNL